MTTIAAGFFVLLAFGVALFQAALVSGAPWGELTMGGRVTGVLPWRLRAVAFVSLLLLLAFAAIVFGLGLMTFGGLALWRRT
jgi:hypothetical protein